LAQLLAKLFSEADNIRFFLRQSQTGVDPHAINFEGPVNVIWDRVLEEAEKRRCIDQVVLKAAERVAPRRAELTEEVERYHQACTKARDQPVITGPDVADSALVVCADGGSKPTQEVMKVLSILMVCPTGLPLQVLSQAIGLSCDSLRAMLSERLELA